MRMCVWHVLNALSFAACLTTAVVATVESRHAAADREAAAADRRSVEAFHARAQPTDSALVADLDDHFGGKIEWSGHQSTGYVVTGFCNAYAVKGVQSLRDAMRIARQLDHDVKVPATCAP